MLGDSLSAPALAPDWRSPTPRRVPKIAASCLPQNTLGGGAACRLGWCEGQSKIGTFLLFVFNLLAALHSTWDLSSLIRESGFLHWKVDS